MYNPPPKKKQKKKQQKTRQKKKRIAREIYSSQQAGHVTRRCVVNTK